MNNVFNNLKISVGGMIASGKSTLVKNMKNRLGMKAIEEFEKDDEVFNTLLEWLYKGVPNIEMLLQIYFIHNHFLRQMDVEGGYITDRDVIEHWLFAQANLKHAPEVMNMYNGLFHAYMGRVKRADVYVILDISWETFKERLFSRGRSSEVDNFDSNEKYFRELLDGYKGRLMAQCVIYDIPYIIVPEMKEDETVDYVIDKLEVMFGER